MIKLLLNKPEGKIVACNIISCLNNGLMTRAAIKSFLKACVKAYSEKPVSTIEKLLDQFQDVASGVRPLRGRKRKYLFQCKIGGCTIMDTDEFCTIMAYGLFIKHLLDDVFCENHHSFSVNADTSEPMLKNSINDLNGKNDIFKPGARLGGLIDRPFFWITKANNIDDILRSDIEEKDIADKIRDRLGLVHHKKGVLLIEIRISGDKLRTSKHARPTIAEACTHLRFKAIPDTAGNLFHKWGWTADLERFAEGHDNIDGAEERVVEPIDFNEDLRAKINYAYLTDKFRGKPSDNDDDSAFADRIFSQLSLADMTVLKNELLGILN